MSAAYATSVAAEMVAAVSGIGWMVLDASKYMRSDVIFVGIIIMGITGILLDKALLYLERRIVFWKGKN
jgi:taurine transport system permease protein